MPSVFIGLGSNLGNREDYIKTARNLMALSGIRITAESSITETDPVIVLNQPKFLNQIIKAETELSPEGLLSELKKIEKNMGREKTISKGPRIIDLDILLYNGIIIEEKHLKIPHPEIKNRKFILDHLIEIEPDLTDPKSGKKYSELNCEYKKHQ